MCRSHRGLAERRQAVPTVDYSQIANEVCDYEDQAPPQRGITDFALRSDRRLQHLLALRKGVRKTLLEVPAGERQQLYLVRKAEEKVHKLARKNRRLSVQHLKGESRKSCRLGVGKSGSRSCWLLEDEDIDAATEHAYASVHESSRCQPLDICPALEQLPESCNSRLWEEAVERAGLAPIGKLTLLKPLPHELQLLVGPLEKTGNPFDALRARFLRRHGQSLIDSLDRCTEGRSLTPAPLAPEVSERFLAACGKRVARLAPGFHGTPGNVHESIFSQGLLIPGQDNDIKVANGSAHGNGVYIAKLSNPWLSQSFARGVNKMLVCGVVDDAIQLSQAARIGSFSVTKQSAKVHHVGDAMVVFESVCVAPLFVVGWQGACCKGVQKKTQLNRHTKHGSRVRERRSRVSYGSSTRYLWAWDAIKHRRGKWLDENFRWRSPYYGGDWRRFAWNQK